MMHNDIDKRRQPGLMDGPEITVTGGTIVRRLDDWWAYPTSHHYEPYPFGTEEGAKAYLRDCDTFAKREAEKRAQQKAKQP